MRALILTPTRELAMQVDESVKTYGKHPPLRSTCVYGGVDIKPQIADLRDGVEIVVATPGRLLDHVQQKSVNLSQVEVLVLDEADRMLDMGFIPDIKRILALLPKGSGRACCSRPRSRTRSRSSPTRMLNAAAADRGGAAQHRRRDRHAPRATRSPQDDKRQLLVHLLQSERPAPGAGLRRAPSTAPAASPASWSARASTPSPIHGDKSQQQRTEALDAFKAGKVRVLVATDVAARGLDIDDLPHVINYELPHVAEDYIHRIGRTGRAGEPGAAISLVAPDEERLLAEIEKLLKKSVPVVSADGFDPAAAASAERRAPRERGARAESSGRAEPAAHRSARPPREERPAAARRDVAQPPRGDRRVEREAAYALNPDQPPAVKANAATPDAAPSAPSRGGPLSRPGFGHNRPVPALLMRRPAAAATEAPAPAATPAAVETPTGATADTAANPAPVMAPAADRTETAQA